MGDAYQTIMNILVFGAAVLVAAAVIIIPRLRTGHSWQNLAARTGLTFTPGKILGKEAQLGGVYRGFPLRLYIDLRGDSDYATSYTCAELKLNRQTGYQVEIISKGLWQKLGDLLGRKVMHTGDDELDSRLVVKGLGVDQISPVLRAPALRQKLLAVRPLHLFVRDRDIYYEKHGEVTNEDYLAALFDLMADLAAALEKNPPAVTWPQI